MKLHLITTHIWLQKNDSFKDLVECHFSSAHIFIPLSDEDVGGIFTNKECLKTKFLPKSRDENIRYTETLSEINFGALQRITFI